MAIIEEIKIVADASDATKEVNKLRNSLDDVQEESKKASKSIDDVASNGGAIAILDSLTGGLATRLKDAYEASKLFNTSLKATRGALIATGIGALVVALGAVVAYWDDIKMFITGANGELERQQDLIADNSAELERELKIISDTENVLRLQGLTEAQIVERKKEALKLLIESNAKELEIAKNRLQSLKAQEEAGISGLERMFVFAQNSATQIGLLLDSVFSRFGLDTEIGENVNQATDSVIESLFGTEADKEAVEQRIREITDQINNAENQLAGFELDARRRAQEAQERINSQPKDLQAVGVVSVEGNTSVGDDPEVIFEQKKAERLAEIDKGLTDELIKNARLELAQRERVAQLKVDLEENTFALLGNLAKEGSKLAKGVAIAQVVRDTTQGVSNIITSTIAGNQKAIQQLGPIAGSGFAIGNTIAGGVGVAASIAGAVGAIKDITSEKKTVSGGSGTSFGGVGGAPSIDAPSFNLVQGSGSNQIADSINGQNRPVRAFVVSNEVTSSQELDRNIQGDASLG